MLLVSPCADSYSCRATLPMRSTEVDSVSGGSVEKSPSSFEGVLEWPASDDDLGQFHALDGPSKMVVQLAPSRGKKRPGDRPLLLTPSYSGL